ncbi:MAG: hypothetical protein NZ822_02190 [Patescibacteria group bacterium]|nr:hypothetical protein [Patescibacteria group bacterium]
MALENYPLSIKIIITEEGAKKIYKSEHQQEAEFYLEEAIRSFKQNVSTEIRDVTFTYFVRKKDDKRQSYVLVIDGKGSKYIYDCQNRTIQSKI